MSISDLIGYGGLGAVLLLSMIQISPIKIDPWSAIAKWIGTAINGNVIDEIAGIKKEIEQIKSDDAERDAKLARQRILRFGDEIYNNTKHSKELFDQILSDIADYEKYCKNHPEFENGKTVLTVRNIEAVYQDCLKNHSFL